MSQPRSWRSRVLVAVALAVAGLVPAGAATAAPATRTTPAAATAAGLAARPTVPTAPAGYRAACAAAPAGSARCFALYRPDRHAARDLAAGRAARPQGLGARDLQSAYRLPTGRAGHGQTIAIVDAYDNPKAEADLAVYRRHYGLPPCTTANGCFHKVNQRGGTRPPDPDPGWGVEISLDLDMVSAACPRCSILLVEGDEPSLGALGRAVDTAVRLGAGAVSNSYGLTEFYGMSKWGRFYDHPGTAITASSGDYGFGPASFPAVLPSVTAVGGTTLARAGNARGWTEQVWEFAGSGCSAYIPKPSYQTGSSCRMRTVADVSAVAWDLAIYDTFHVPGWIQVGGTSASAPLIAGMVGLAGNAGRFSPGYPYRHASSFFDVRTGSNGYCGGDYLCSGVAGYDAPTGVGTPNGVSGL